LNYYEYTTYTVIFVNLHGIKFFMHIFKLNNTICHSLNTHEITIKNTNEKQNINNVTMVIICQ